MIFHWSDQQIQPGRSDFATRLCYSFAASYVNQLFSGRILISRRVYCISLNRRRHAIGSSHSSVPLREREASGLFDYAVACSICAGCMSNTSQRMWLFLSLEFVFATGRSRLIHWRCTRDNVITTLSFRAIEAVMVSLMWGPC